MMTESVGIYIHIPFCLSKCYYCDFCSVSRADSEKRERYVESLCNEIRSVCSKIRSYGKGVPVADTVYFGGGTPTVLSVSQLERILKAVEASFGISCNAEITVEANPKSVSADSLHSIRALGVNRLSIGMQSAHDSELRALGRIHGSSDFLTTFDCARTAGFDNISVDLMYGIPNQTKESFESSIEAVLSVVPEHISSYSLIIEENTPFFHRKDTLTLPDDDTVCDMYLNMSDTLRKYGYEKYEISNFAHNGKESKHNLKYWTYCDYIGFGPAAHSFISGVRYAHSRDIDAYIDGKNIYEQIEKIGIKEAMSEYVMLGMRLSRGIDKAEFLKRFGTDFDSVFKEKISKYIPRHIDDVGSSCRLTDEGMLVSNYVLSDILDF